VRFAKWVDERFMGGFTKRDASEGQNPALPTHTGSGGGGGGSRANGGAPTPAPYRDVEPDVANGSAHGLSKEEEEEESKENVELTELPPREEGRGSLV
jgi:hypothetical protein